MNIAIIGTGYAGLVTGVCFAEPGVHVICVDVDEERIAKLQSGKVPIHELQLGEMLDMTLRGVRNYETRGYPASDL
jgi:UDPglucose 6-dehydrogenase